MVMCDALLIALSKLRASGAGPRAKVRPQRIAARRQNELLAIIGLQESELLNGLMRMKLTVVELLFPIE